MHISQWRASETDRIYELTGEAPKNNIQRNKCEGNPWNLEGRTGLYENTFDTAKSVGSERWACLPQCTCQRHLTSPWRLTMSVQQRSYKHYPDLLGVFGTQLASRTHPAQNLTRIINWAQDLTDSTVKYLPFVIITSWFLIYGGH